MKELNPSQVLFNQIIESGISYINDCITNKICENYYLDFKVSEEADYTGKRSLGNSDKKNYGKCISAFGNSEGGVVIWGIVTGKDDEDYAISKKPIKNVSNFLSLLEGFTSLVTSPPHPSVENKIIWEDEKENTGYVITRIPKSHKRPFQVINAGEFRYYIRAGSNSSPAPDIFLRSLFGQGTQPNAFIIYGTAPVKIEGDTIVLALGVIVHNKGENVAKNLNGYVYVGGKDMALEVNRKNGEDFFYNSNNISGMKIGFVAKPHFILGVEQEVLPLTIHIKINKPVSKNGILIETLLNCDNQQSYRSSKRILENDLEKIYDSYMSDQTFNIVEAIIGKGEED